MTLMGIAPAKKNSSVLNRKQFWSRRCGEPHRRGDFGQKESGNAASSRERRIIMTFPSSKKEISVNVCLSSVQEFAHPDSVVLAKP